VASNFSGTPKYNMHSFTVNGVGFGGQAGEGGSISTPQRCMKEIFVSGWYKCQSTADTAADDAPPVEYDDQGNQVIRRAEVEEPPGPYAYLGDFVTCMKIHMVCACVDATASTGDDPVPEIEGKMTIGLCNKKGGRRFHYHRKTYTPKCYDAVDPEEPWAIQQVCEADVTWHKRDIRPVIDAEDSSSNPPQGSADFNNAVRCGAKTKIDENGAVVLDWDPDSYEGGAAEIAEIADCITLSMCPSCEEENPSHTADTRKQTETLKRHIENMLDYEDLDIGCIKAAELQKRTGGGLDMRPSLCDPEQL